MHQGTVLDATDDEWTFAFELNCRSMFRTMRAFLPGMLERGHGVILNMASVASSLKGVPSRFIYSATKAAVIGMTRSVAADYVTRGIRANCLCPGTVQTPSLDERIAVNAAAAGSVEAARAAFVARQPMGRLGSPEEIAALAVYLASDAAQFITGQAVVIDGGLTLVNLGGTTMKLLRYGPAGAEKPAMLDQGWGDPLPHGRACETSTASRCRRRR